MTKVMQTLSTLVAQPGALSGKCVFIRADLNVPFDAAGNISEDTRIRASLRGIQMARDAGAAVMVTSHLGRPKEGVLTQADSLQPVAKRLSELLKMPVPLVQDWVAQGVKVVSDKEAQGVQIAPDKVAQAVQVASNKVEQDVQVAPHKVVWAKLGITLLPGQVVLLENCRVNIGEKANDETLARKMAALCDVYVNDAFATAHRAEATTYGMARFAQIACAGPLLEAELSALGRVLHAPQRPLVAIVGGSKVSTKFEILEFLANTVDQLIVGGGIANTFLLAQGKPIGKSLAEPDQVDQARKILARMQVRGAEMPLPTDVVCAPAVREDAPVTVKPIDAVSAEDMILDIGPDTACAFAKILMAAQQQGHGGTIVWNGPVGVFECEPFSHGTQRLAQAIANSPAFSIAGGGDTLAAIAKFGITKKIGYISTGGGAFLEYLEGKTLPAVAILQERAARNDVWSSVVCLWRALTRHCKIARLLQGRINSGHKKHPIDASE